MSLAANTSQARADRSDEPRAPDGDEDSGVLSRAAFASAQDTYPPRYSKRLRELLAEDRERAGEARSCGQAAALTAGTPYQAPLRLLWRDFRRENRRALRQGAIATATATALLALSGLWFALRSEPSTSIAAAGKPARTAPAAVIKPRPAAGPSKVQTPAVVAPTQPAQAPSQLDTTGFSTRKRLVRADALLRHPSQRAAVEARALLELTLPEVPKDAHGRAALAEACLRLHDETCARAAMAEALALRPLRSRYRALAREVERTFGEQQNAH